MRVLDGGGQYCDDCTPSEPVIQRGASSVITSVPTCPNCGRGLEAGTTFCVCQAVRPGELQYGGFLVRLVAYLIDGFILGVFGVFVTFATTPSNAFLVNLAAGVIYHVGFWVAEGATPGKMAMGLKVRSLDGSPIDLGQGIMRMLGYWVSGLILGIGFLVILFNEEKRGLHDYMANTIVVVDRS